MSIITSSLKLDLEFLKVWIGFQFMNEHQFHPHQLCFIYEESQIDNEKTINSENFPGFQNIDQFLKRVLQILLKSSYCNTKNIIPE